MPGPLDGVRILDCTSVVLGPWAAQQLGDLGADVIKIESPEGDTTRQLGPRRHAGMAAFYLGCNRNKRSLVLDLKQEAAKRALYRHRRARRRADAQLPPRAGGAARHGLRGLRADQPASHLRRDVRLPRGRSLRQQGGVRRHHPGRRGPRVAADRGGGHAALHADHRRGQDQLERRRVRGAGGALRARADGRRAGGRGADVRDPGVVRHGRAPVRRKLRPRHRHPRVQADPEQSATPLRDQGRLPRHPALHRRPLA